jgi:hypothetical protein
MDHTILHAKKEERHLPGLCNDRRLEMYTGALLKTECTFRKYYGISVPLCQGAVI